MTKHRSRLELGKHDVSPAKPDYLPEHRELYLEIWGHIYVSVFEARLQKVHVT